MTHDIPKAFLPSILLITDSFHNCLQLTVGAVAHYLPTDGSSSLPANLQRFSEKKATKKSEGGEKEEGNAAQSEKLFPLNYHYCILCRPSSLFWVTGRKKNKIGVFLC